MTPDRREAKPTRSQPPRAKARLRAEERARRRRERQLLTRVMTLRQGGPRRL